jgi:hypothetical protein
VLAGRPRSTARWELAFRGRPTVALSQKDECGFALAQVEGLGRGSGSSGGTTPQPKLQCLARESTMATYDGRGRLQAVQNAASPSREFQPEEVRMTLRTISVSKAAISTCQLQGRGGRFEFSTSPNRICPSDLSSSRPESRHDPPTSRTHVLQQITRAPTRSAIPTGSAALLASR